MADGQAGGGPRRIVLFFRNDLRIRDNVIVHQAVQKVKAGEYDEVSGTQACSSSSSKHSIHFSFLTVLSRLLVQLTSSAASSHHPLEAR